MESVKKSENKKNGRKKNDEIKLVVWRGYLVNQLNDLIYINLKKIVNIILYLNKNKLIILT